MNMIVCCKQVIDPEAPPASFKVDAASNTVIPPPGVPPVISPFDENAVEAALKIKDAQGGKITAISLGANLTRDVVKKPLSMGADELVLLEDEAFVNGDSWSTAYALAMAIKKIGEYDIIFCGRQAADWDSGQVGSGYLTGGLQGSGTDYYKEFFIWFVGDDANGSLFSGGGSPALIFLLICFA